MKEDKKASAQIRSGEVKSIKMKLRGKYRLWSEGTRGQIKKRKSVLFWSFGSFLLLDSREGQPLSLFCLTEAELVSNCPRRSSIN